MSHRAGFIAFVAAGAAMVALAACGPRDAPPPVAGGDPQRGKEAIGAYGCAACHRIPGVRGARGIVGPPLAGFGSRTYIAGSIPNRPDGLTRWIMDAPSLRPDTAMPNMRVPLSDAKDVAAYLYSLR